MQHVQPEVKHVGHTGHHYSGSPKAETPLHMGKRSEIIEWGYSNIAKFLGSCNGPEFASECRWRTESLQS